MIAGASITESLFDLNIALIVVSLMFVAFCDSLKLIKLLRRCAFKIVN